ncbi:MAG: ImmA/IrrE family metallo-endopeptidase, partial [Clostridia bacterium]
CYGIYFACEKAMSGSKIRGCFKVRGKNPAIYVTDNYAGKDSFYYELFHELGHCKSDYNEAKNKVIVEGNEEQEDRADKFALNVMINSDIWQEILASNFIEKNLLAISKHYKVPMSFIVGRLAKNNKIKYNSTLYQKYYKK